MNFNQPEGTIVEIETRGEMRKRTNRERNAARRAGNRDKKTARHAEELRPDENVLNQPSGTIVDIETRGQMRERTKREQKAAKRAENRERKAARYAEELRPDENALNQHGGTSVVEIETVGEIRKKQKRERKAARRAEKPRSREYQRSLCF